MIIETCPTDVVQASAERVWDLLTDTDRLAQWSGTKLVDDPHTHRLSAGDHLVFRAHWVFTVTFDVRAVEPLRELSIDVALPFGVVNRETIHVTPLDGARCRVSFG